LALQETANCIGKKSGILFFIRKENASEFGSNENVLCFFEEKVLTNLAYHPQFAPMSKKRHFFSNTLLINQGIKISFLFFTAISN